MKGVNNTVRITEFERDRQCALQTAFDLGYPTRFIKQIILAKKPVEVDQAMVSGRQSDEWESARTVREHLAMEGIRIPTMRITVGQNFVD